MKCIIEVVGQDQTLSVEQGTTLMDALTQANVFLRSDCGGGGGCGKCKVYIEGRETKGREIFACSYKVEEDLVVTIPEASLLSFHIIKKAPLKLPEAFIAVPNSSIGVSYGLAVDLGTTTLAIYLCELSSRKVLSSLSIKNPQAMYGDDVMSRIEVSGKGVKKLAQLQRCVVHALEQGARQLLNHCDLKVSQLTRMVVVGNPTMIHILLGESPTSIGISPYQPAFNESRFIDAIEIGLLFPDLKLQTLPQVSGFIGGDILSATLAADLENETPGTLLVDLGTNGEIMFKGEDGFYATSCATGPAFEGASLSCGMQAVPGAIDRITIEENGASLSYTMVSGENGKEVAPLGICGSGIISGVGAMLRTAIVQKNGAFTKEYTVSSSRNGSQVREYLVVPAEATSDAHPITINQKDIRSVQLGKAALITGIEFLMKAAGIKKVKKIIIAGTFGSYLDKHDMLALGMLPEIDPDHIEISGNAAGAGAIMVLCDENGLAKVEKITEKLSIIELALDSKFQAAFVERLSF